MLPIFKRSWILGEDKYIDLEVRSRQPGPVVIPRADWTLTPDGEVQPEQFGVCEVDRGRISTLVEPQKVGVYTLEVTYEVPPEVRKVQVILDVH